MDIKLCLVIKNYRIWLILRLNNPTYICWMFRFFCELPFQIFQFSIKVSVFFLGIFSYFFQKCLDPIVKHKWRLPHTDKKFSDAGSVVHTKSLQSCPTLCKPMVCSLPGSSVRGILQARILEWIATPFSRGSSWPRDHTHVCGFCITVKILYCWVTEEAQIPVGYPRVQLLSEAIYLKIDADSAGTVL